MNRKDKTIFITDGISPLGKQIARQAAEEGMQVVPNLGSRTLPGRMSRMGVLLPTRTCSAEKLLTMFSGKS